MSDISIYLPVPVFVVIGFALWAVFLVLLVGLARVGQVLSGKRKPNEFPAGERHGGDMYWRMNRAHLNTVENLPIVAAIIYGGVLMDVQGEMFNQVCLIILGARVVQSLIHIASGSVIAVNLRFAAYLAQIVCLIQLVVLYVK